MKRWRPGREALLLLYFPVYLLLYVLAERCVQAGYWVSHCALDDRIPFVKEFVYAYILWFPLMIGMTLWLLTHDRRAFLRYGGLLILSTLIGFAIFFILPSGQELRPAAVEGRGLSAMLMRLIYAVDTNTNVFPSLHVVGTLVATAGALDTDTLPAPWKWAIAVAGVFINLSTLFCKQHSVLDVVSAVILFALTYPLVYVLPGKLKRRGLRARM